MTYAIIAAVHLLVMQGECAQAGHYPTDAESRGEVTGQVTVRGCAMPTTRAMTAAGVRRMISEMTRARLTAR